MMPPETNTAILVPARLASARFPNKLLHVIRGRSLIVHVGERIRSQVPDIRLVFAVEDVALQIELQSHGFECLMTSKNHQSGTDRLAEANKTVRAEHIINVQGDEPLVTEDQIRKLAALLHRGVPMGTLATEFDQPEDFLDPNQVKVVLDYQGKALYFSRAPLPYFRNSNGIPTQSDLANHRCYRHLGMYAYKAEFLEAFSTLPRGKLEQLERLEQLRALENGHAIAVDITNDPSIGVDTPKDAERFETYL